jgi:3-dehydroquinate dehydratase-1
METVRVRDLVLGDGNPKICVPVIAHSYDELKGVLDEVVKSDPDMVEFRADFYFEEELPALAAIRNAVGGRPVLYTIRTREEGGEIAITEESYIERNLAATQYVDLIDLQLERLHPASGGGKNKSLVERVREMGAKVILSWHDFEGTPSKGALIEKMTRMERSGCDIGKIACMPRSRRDVLALMEVSVEMLEERAERPFITMAMGNLGRVTRAAGAFTGSCITFATAGMMSAPGQISAARLKPMLHELTA